MNDPLSRAVAQIPWGNTTLFLGAGFTVGARNLRGDPVLTGNGLRDLLLDEADVHEEREHYNLQSAADEYVSQPRSDIIRLLIDNFTISSVTEDHCAIAKYSFRRIYTTNYDNCFHFASSQIGHKCVDLDLRDKPDERLPDVNHVIHIHGKITNITRENYASQFYVTDPGAKPIPFTTGTMATHFRNDLLLSEWVVFIGYSLADPHIRAIMADQGQGVFDRTIFIGHESDPAPLRKQYGPYGTYYPIGLNGFLDRLKSAPPLQKRVSGLPNNFRAVNFSHDAAADSASRDEVRNEFLLGTARNSNFVARTLIEGKCPYYAHRPIKMASNNICIHGDTGNGKTVIAKQLLEQLTASGYRVIEYTGGVVEPVTIANYAEENSNLVIFVEDIVGKLDVMHSLKTACGESTKFVVTSKTKDYEIRKADIVSAFGAELQFLSCNKLASVEIADLIRILDTNYLWGDYADADVDRKAFIIRETCKAEIRGLLFALFEGGAVRVKMDAMFTRLRQLRQDHFDIVCLNCLFNYSRIRNKEYFQRLGTLDDLLNLRVDYSEFSAELRHLGLSEIFNVDTGEFNIKSAILSRYFITNHLEIEGLLDLVLRCLKQIELCLFDDDMFYEDLCKALLQFNLYRELFSRNDVVGGTLTIESSRFHTAMWNFYEQCKELRIARDDPLFVIQLSKSYLSKGDFSTCYELINTADRLYRPRSDRFHLETHKAEVLVKDALARDRYVDFKNEREALDLLRGVILRRNDMYHPFGVLKLLLDSIERHLPVLVKKNNHDFVGMLPDIVQLSKRFPNEYSNRYSFVNDVAVRAKRLEVREGQLRR